MLPMRCSAERSPVLGWRTSTNAAGPNGTSSGQARPVGEGDALGGVSDRAGWGVCPSGGPTVVRVWSSTLGDRGRPADRPRHPRPAGACTPCSTHSPIGSRRSCRTCAAKGSSRTPTSTRRRARSASPCWKRTSRCRWCASSSSTSRSGPGRGGFAGPQPGPASSRSSMRSSSPSSVARPAG